MIKSMSCTQEFSQVLSLPVDAHLLRRMWRVLQYDIFEIFLKFGRHFERHQRKHTAVVQTPHYPIR